MGRQCRCNLAAMIGTTENLSILEDDNTDNLSDTSTVQAVVNWFRPLDFLKIDEPFTELGIPPKFGKTSMKGAARKLTCAKFYEKFKTKKNEKYNTRF